VRVVSGVQPSGNLHLGNYLGAVRQFVALQDQPGNECFFFVADLHAMTTIQDGRMLRSLALQVAADYLALGVDPARAVVYLQSDVPRVTELAWMLSTVTPMGLLRRGHSYKEKVARGIAPSHGLFAYPVLMAADILIVRGDRVPVGRDQRQHLEMTRDIAEAFNRAHGERVLRLPAGLVLADAGQVPGIDGRKMSKSYGNTIELFASEREIRESVMSIVTDSTPLDTPKPTRGSVLHTLLKLLTPASEWPVTRKLFTDGGHGYGEIKERLLSVILETFRAARLRRQELLRDPGYTDEVLRSGAERARAVAEEVLAECRRVSGLGG